MAEAEAEVASAARRGGNFLPSSRRMTAAAKYSRLEMDMGDYDDSSSHLSSPSSSSYFSATKLIFAITTAVLFFVGISYGQRHSNEHFHHPQQSGGSGVGVGTAEGGDADGTAQILVEQETDPCRVVSCPLPSTSTTKDGEQGGGWKYNTVPLALTCCSQLSAFLSVPDGPEGYDFSKEFVAGTLCRGGCFLAASRYLDCRSDDYSSDACRALKEGCLGDLGTILDGESDECPAFVNCPALAGGGYPTSVVAVKRECCADATAFQSTGRRGEDPGGRLCGGTCKRAAIRAAVLDVTDRGGGGFLEELTTSCRTEEELDVRSGVGVSVAWDGHGAGAGGQYWVSCATIRHGLPNMVKGYSVAMDRTCCERLADYAALIDSGDDGEWRGGAVKFVETGGDGSHLCRGECFENSKTALETQGVSNAFNNICSEAHPEEGIKKAKEVVEEVIDQGWKEEIENEEIAKGETEGDRGA